VRYWLWMADAVALLHAAYVAFVVLGFAAIVIGGVLKARWVRNFRFRIVHLVAMALVLVEAVVGIRCPLTVLENDLRIRSGDIAHSGDFIAYWTHRLIFYNWPAWVFTLLYLGFTIAIVAVLVLVPPKGPHRRTPAR
jgi:hypothetical protein